MEGTVIYWFYSQLGVHWVAIWAAVRQKKLMSVIGFRLCMKGFHGSSMKSHEYLSICHSFSPILLLALLLSFDFTLFSEIDIDCELVKQN